MIDGKSQRSCSEIVSSAQKENKLIKLDGDSKTGKLRLPRFKKHTTVKLATLKHHRHPTHLHDHPHRRPRGQDTGQEWATAHLEAVWPRARGLFHTRKTHYRTTFASWTVCCGHMYTGDATPLSGSIRKNKDSEMVESSN
jgi:hypothetical protein